MARYVDPKWWPEGGWWYYGDAGIGRSNCWALWPEFNGNGVRDGTWSVCAPNTPPGWHYPNFPDLETAKAWTVLEASNG